jgi:hypothetical protein
MICMSYASLCYQRICRSVVSNLLAARSDPKFLFKVKTGEWPVAWIRFTRLVITRLVTCTILLPWSSSLRDSRGNNVMSSCLDAGGRRINALE